MIFFLFIENSDLCSFSNNNTLFSYGDNLSVILSSLEYDIEIYLRWFNVNPFKVNPGKFQFMILGKSLRTKYYLTIGPINIKESDHVELLGIIIDKHLSFKNHFENLCRNSNYKLHALKCMPKYLTGKKPNYLVMLLLIDSSVQLCSFNLNSLPKGN